MTPKENRSIEIRWHGRGGQGAVTSAELVALAAIAEGKFAQGFPSFGPERRGAPVLAFNRISDTEIIRNRAGVAHPDIVVVLDPGLLDIIDVTLGLKETGTVIINTPRSLADMRSELGGKVWVVVVNARAIAKEKLGVPIVNTTMLGALIKVTGVVSLESITEVLKERFGNRAKNNIEACYQAYNETLVAEPDVSLEKPEKPLVTEKLPSWWELLPGCIVTEPQSARESRTGDWRSQRPLWNQERCIKCGICYLFCPEACIKQDKDGYFEADLYYCKGCGICFRECWTEAVTMVEEAKL